MHPLVALVYIKTKNFCLLPFPAPHPTPLYIAPHLASLPLVPKTNLLSQSLSPALRLSQTPKKEKEKLSQKKKNKAVIITQLCKRKLRKLTNTNNVDNNSFQ